MLQILFKCERLLADRGDAIRYGDLRSATPVSKDRIPYDGKAVFIHQLFTSFKSAIGNALYAIRNVHLDQLLLVAEGGNYDVVITEKGAAASNVGIVTVTNNTSYTYDLQSFTYGATGPVDYKVIENGQIEPGASIFGAIVVSTDTPVVVVVNGAATQINIPAGGVTFYCFAVKEGGEFVVEINPAA